MNVIISEILLKEYEPKNVKISKPDSTDYPTEKAGLVSDSTSPEIDLTTEEIVALASAGGSFNFLNNPDEDIYSLADGEEI